MEDGPSDGKVLKETSSGKENINNHLMPHPFSTHLSLD